MPSPTANMGLRKGVDADNAKTYLDTDLPFSLDLVDVHDHNGTTTGLPVKSLHLLGLGRAWAFSRLTR